MFLNDNYRLSTIISEAEADKAIEELKGLVLRSMDLVEKRVEEVEEKSEKESWDFITNNGERTIDEVKNR